MIRCGFCSYENPDTSTSCVACGFVFTDVPAEQAPQELDVTGEVTGGAAGEAPDAGGAEPVPAGAEPAPSGARDAPEPDELFSLARLFDPGALRNAARQARVLLSATASLTAVGAVLLVVDTGDIADEAGATIGSGPTLLPRTDLLAVAETAVFVGCLVMLAGWAQRVAANRSLLTSVTPQSGQRATLLAWVVPFANAVAAPRLMAELWDDTGPRTGRRPDWWAMWVAVFAVGAFTRAGAAVVELFLTARPGSAGDAWALGGALIFIRVTWLAALVLTWRLVGALTERQCRQAEALSA